MVVRTDGQVAEFLLACPLIFLEIGSFRCLLFDKLGQPWLRTTMPNPNSCDWVKWSDGEGR